MKRACLAVLALSGLSACGADRSAIDCIDDDVTIARGVYGRVIYGCDTEDCQASAAAGAVVEVYRDLAAEPGYPRPTPDASLTCDGRGMYQVELDVGIDYWLCRPSQACTQVRIDSASQRLRRDFASGPGGGNWWEGSCMRL